MAQLPYYALTQGNLEMERPQEIVDEYAPLREGLNQAQKYFEQKEAVEASKILSKARSDWSIKMNEMQQQAGLDYEGFSEKVNQGLQDYENEIISSVPFSQREKFSADFAGIKYDMLNKAGAYEITASAEKIKLDMDEIATNSANTILSDPSQYETVVDAFNDTVDGLQVADSVKAGLKKEGVGTLAVAQINALTNINPDYLLSQLKGGYYDSVIDSEQKAAAMNQATNKIKSNKLEVKKLVKEKQEQMLNEDMSKVISGEYTETDLVKLAPKYANNMSDYDKLWKQHDRLEKRGVMIKQTSIDLYDGAIDAADKIDQNRMDMLYDVDVSALDNADPNSFNIKKRKANDIVSKGGYLPKSFSMELKHKLNSSNYQDIADAGVAYYEAKQINHNLVTSLKDDVADELYYIGAAHAAGKPLKEIVDSLRVAPPEHIAKVRETKFKDLYKKGKIKGDLDVEDIAASNSFDDVTRFWFLRTGDMDLAVQMGEEFVNTNYENNIIGSGVAKWYQIDAGDIELSEDKFSSSVRARSMPIFRGPMKEYGGLMTGMSNQEKTNYLARDLLQTVSELVDGAKYEDITITNDNKSFDKQTGKPIYLIMYRGAPLLNENNQLVYWKPDLVGYLSKMKSNGEK